MSSENDTTKSGGFGTVLGHDEIPAIYCEALRIATRELRACLDSLPKRERKKIKRDLRDTSEWFQAQANRNDTANTGNVVAIRPADARKRELNALMWQLSAVTMRAMAGEA